jgi:dipeptidyl aminopeptidase/acylaminoacyl peptidase
MQEGHKYPAIVYLYGGPVPGGSARTVVNKWVHIPDLWAQMMAILGFVVYSLDNRGSCEAPRGHGFERPIWQRFGAVELADQLEGVKYLQTLPFVDGSRIGVFGGSFGGFMALNCLLRAPEIFKTGVAFAPVTDWTGYDAIYTEQYMGQLAENAHGYAGSLLPPVAGRLKGKLLLIHGTADQNVHLHHSFNLVDALVAAGKQIEMMLYPGMTHADFFRISPQGRQLFERITKFFVEHL